MTSHDSRNQRTPAQETHEFAGVPITATTPLEAAHRLSQLAVTCKDTAQHVHLVNAYTLALADSDPEYAQLLSSDSINFPDGRPLSVVSKMMGQRPPLQQVRGPKLFLDVFDVGRNYGVKHYLLGSSTQVLEKLQHNLLRRFPGCQIVGVESPPYRVLSAEELKAQDERITRVRPDIVWVGLGTPKQDREAKRIAQTTGIMSIAVGAAFDFAAGEVREAPGWMTKLCLEWLFRFCTEPRRLWRRYVFGNLKFLQIIFSSFVGYGKNR